MRLRQSPATRTVRRRPKRLGETGVPPESNRDTQVAGAPSAHGHSFFRGTLPLELIRSQQPLPRHQTSYVRGALARPSERCRLSWREET